MKRIVILLITYIVLAAAAGWWPFSDSVIRVVLGHCSYEAGYDDGWDGVYPTCHKKSYIYGYDQGNFLRTVNGLNVGAEIGVNSIEINVALGRNCNAYKWNSISEIISNKLKSSYRLEFGRGQRP